MAWLLRRQRVCAFRSVRGGGWGGWASGDRFLHLISFLSQARAALFQPLRAEYIKERSPFVTVSFRLLFLGIWFIIGTRFMDLNKYMLLEL